MTIPTLSTVGVVSDPVQKLDRLLAYMFVADQNQTYVFGTNVLTVSKLWQLNLNRPDVFASQLKTQANTYLSSHFEQVIVDVSYSVDESGKVSVSLEVRVFDGNTQYGTDWRFKAANSRIVEVAKLLNFGIEP
jgi:hypothetical protein